MPERSHTQCEGFVSRQACNFAFIVKRPTVFIAEHKETFKMSESSLSVLASHHCVTGATCRLILQFE